MPRGRPSTALRDLGALLASGTVAGLSDEQLLHRFADRKVEAAGASAEAEAAFSALVDRHGPMVWGVCLRALGDPHEAEDAFQATFLVLARRADSVRVDDSLGRWLYRVSHRVAARARADARGRRALESSVGPRPAVPSPDDDRGELMAALDEELARLPAKLREPILLCHLEGLTYAEAADRVGRPVATIKGRLARGRALLRARLERRGLGWPSAMIGARAAVPPSLAARTTRAVAEPSARTLALSQGVTRTMIVPSLAKFIAVLAPASVGLWLIAGQAPGPRDSPNPPVAISPTPAPRADPPGRRPIVVPMPPPKELSGLLRRAAEAAMTGTRDEPPSYFDNQALTSIAEAQAVAGDLVGARMTFDAAYRRADGEFSGRPDVFHLNRVALLQAKAGLRAEARVTLARAAEVAPGLTRFLAADEKDRPLVAEVARNNNAMLQALASIAANQSQVGDHEGAKRTVERLDALLAEYRLGSPDATAEAALTPGIAAAHAGLGDFDGAFRRVGSVVADSEIGEVALAAARSLDRAEARRFVEEAARRLDSIGLADRKYHGLGMLAEAQARVGDFEAAIRSARSIGEGPTRVDYDMTDGQPYALLLVAIAQREAGDLAGARATLRDGHRTIVDHPKMRFIESRVMQIAPSQALFGDPEGASRTVALIPEDRRADILATIALAQAVAGDGRAAEATVALATKSALESAKRNTSMRNPSTVAPANLARYWALAGDEPAALKAIQTLHAPAITRGLVIRQVASALASAGDVNGSLRLAINEAKTTSERMSGLNGLGEGVASRLQMESSSRPAR